jgi:hypothetical protein
LEKQHMVRTWHRLAVYACALTLHQGVLHAAPAGYPMSDDAVTWAALKDSQNVDALRAFADRKSNRFAAQARARIRVLDAAALPPTPAVNARTALAHMVRFEEVAQMGASVQPLTTASMAMVPVAAPAPVPVPVAAPVPAPAPVIVATVQGATETSVATAQTLQAPQSPAAEIPQQPNIRLMTLRTTQDVKSTDVPPSMPVAAPTEPRDPRGWPAMRVFEMPVLPTAFCKQEDMNAYLTSFHMPLYDAASQNNQAAIAYLQSLNAQFVAAGEAGNAPGATDRIVKVGDELKAYKEQADRHFRIAAEVQALDSRIRVIRIDPLGDCSRAPWPSPVSVRSVATLATE